MVIASTALADLVAASIGRRELAPVSAFEWYVDTSTWSVVTDQRLIDWVDRRRTAGCLAPGRGGA